MNDADLQRLRQEQDFFDHEEYQEGPIPASTIERYTLCRRPFLPAEYPFWALGDVRGKRILELGCGDGGNAILLALKGATVTGIDISPRAVEVAGGRARLHGVADRVEFRALPLEAYIETAGGKFDIICGFAVLHHLCPVLDPVMEGLGRLAHDRTFFLFAEPVTLWPWLRRLRMALPLEVHGTPDERPLGPRELAILRRRLPGFEMRVFGLLLRVWGRLGFGRYEEYSPLRRLAYHALARIDRVILALPGLRALGSSAVITAGPRPDAKV